MLRRSCIVAAILMMAAPAVLAQNSPGAIDLGKMRQAGAVFRVMFSATDAICPRQTGMFRIGKNGIVTDISVILRGDSPDYRMNPTAAPNEFTYRRRIDTDFCRIDIDIGEQQKRNGEWTPLIYPLARGLDAILESADKKDDYPASQIEMYIQNSRAGPRGSLRQGVTATYADYLRFEGAKDCFDATGTFVIDKSGVTLLFPTNIGSELNQFSIERVEVDADHSALNLSQGSCRVVFAISASTSRDGVWTQLPILPFKESRP